MFVFCAYSIFAQTYQVNQFSVTQPNLKITTIQITDTATIVNLSFTPKTACKVGIYPPGHQMAFFLRDVTGKKTYQLINYSNIGIQPLSETVNAYATKTFTLYFEKIDVKRFHMVEGEILSPNSTTWHFSNIQLK